MPNRLSYPLAHGPPGYAKPKANELPIPTDPAATQTNNPMMANATSPHRERETLEGRANKVSKGAKRGPKPKVRVNKLADIDDAEETIGGMGGLTLRMRVFCREYLATKGNATQAALLAGYSQNSAHVIGAQNLSKLCIRQEIGRLQAETARSVDISPARVLRRLDALSHAAEEAGQYAAAKGCEQLIGQHIGMFIERSLNVSVSASSAHLEALLEVARRRSSGKDEPTLIEG